MRRFLFFPCLYLCLWELWLPSVGDLRRRQACNASHVFFFVRGYRRTDFVSRFRFTFSLILADGKGDKTDTVQFFEVFDFVWLLLLLDYQGSDCTVDAVYC